MHLYMQIAPQLAKSKPMHEGERTKSTASERLKI